VRILSAMSQPLEQPKLGNQYLDDRPLRALLRRRLPSDVLTAVEPSLLRMGGLAAGALLELCRRHRLDEPRFIAFDAWGERIDAVQTSAAWDELARLSRQEGLLAIPYERQHGPHSRVWQLALAYLFDRSAQLYTCPLAMTDGAARTLELHGSAELEQRVLSRLTTREPQQGWISGQWMTERSGGSDVGASETVARQEGANWRLYGTKYFASAINCDVALTLARPEGQGPGSRHLALFLVETHDRDGRPNGIVLRRLKEKLGTRHLPTAEITLEGTLAVPIAGLSEGVRHIGPMLNITRLWNAVCAAASLRRGLALVRDFARQRQAFGARLADKPLYLDTMASLAAEHEAALQIAFFAAELVGREETGLQSEHEAALLRVVIPLAKLLTARQAVSAASEVVEAFGGAGYIEDTGIPELLRDAQVLPIWEGTTNVLALETCRVMSRTGAMAAMIEEVQQQLSAVSHPLLTEPSAAARRGLQSARAFFVARAGGTGGELEASARRLAITVGRSFALALLVAQAQWAIETTHDARSAHAARRFAATGVDLLEPALGDEPTRLRALALDEPAEA
jgi:acyl-CoA dehydrogenase